MNPKDWMFDKRVIKRNLKKATYTIKEYQDHLAQLPDSGEKGEYVDVLEDVQDGEKKADKSEGEESTGPEAR